MPITPRWQGEQTTDNQGNQVHGSADYNPLVLAAEAECKEERNLLRHALDVKEAHGQCAGFQRPAYLRKCCGFDYPGLNRVDYNRSKFAAL
jgi:hypothetical protein